MLQVSNHNSSSVTLVESSSSVKESVWKVARIVNQVMPGRIPQLVSFPFPGSLNKIHAVALRSEKIQTLLQQNAAIESRLRRFIFSNYQKKDGYLSPESAQIHERSKEDNFLPKLFNQFEASKQKILLNEKKLAQEEQSAEQLKDHLARIGREVQQKLRGRYFHLGQARRELLNYEPHLMRSKAEWEKLNGEYLKSVNEVETLLKEQATPLTLKLRKALFCPETNAPMRDAVTIVLADRSLTVSASYLGLEISQGKLVEREGVKPLPAAQELAKRALSIRPNYSVIDLASTVFSDDFKDENAEEACSLALQSCISFETFGNPLALPCGHTLDAADLKHAIHNCPLCRHPIGLRAELKPNEVIAHLIATLTTKGVNPLLKASQEKLQKVTFQLKDAERQLRVLQEVSPIFKALECLFFIKDRCDALKLDLYYAWSDKATAFVIEDFLAKFAPLREIFRSLSPTQLSIVINNGQDVKMTLGEIAEFVLDEVNEMANIIVNANGTLPDLQKKIDEHTVNCNAIKRERSADYLEFEQISTRIEDETRYQKRKSDVTPEFIARWNAIKKLEITIAICEEDGIDSSLLKEEHAEALRSLHSLTHQAEHMLSAFEATCNSKVPPLPNISFPSRPILGKMQVIKLD